MTALLTERLEWLKDAPILSGSHGSFDDGCCVMECVAYVAGEPHTDHPACACPIITSFMIGWNDCLPNDAERDRLLKPIVPLLVGTRANKEIEQKRGFMAADWLIRTFTPTWLRLVPSLAVHAETLAKSPEIVSVADLVAITPILVNIGKQAVAARTAAAAGAAAWNAARAAARVAAGAAARTAAAALDAGAAAWNAALDAAGAAAWNAAGAAAWNAARAALKPTVEHLQQSALQLVHRMIDCQ